MKNGNNNSNNNTLQSISGSIKSMQGSVDEIKKTIIDNHRLTKEIHSRVHKQ